MEGIEGVIECLNAGDALTFVDAIMHGSAERVNPGQRRMAVYRYGPSWGCLRYPFKISDAMLARLTAERRTILEPQPQSLVPPGAAA
jgi:hypothetical protein